MSYRNALAARRKGLVILPNEKRARFEFDGGLS